MARAHVVCSGSDGRSLGKAHSEEGVKAGDLSNAVRRGPREGCLEQYHIAPLEPGSGRLPHSERAEFKSVGKREGGGKWHTHSKRPAKLRSSQFLPCRKKMPLRIARGSDFLKKKKDGFLCEMFLSFKNCVGQTKLSASWILSVGCQSAIPDQKASGIIFEGSPNVSLDG